LSEVIGLFQEEATRQNISVNLLANRVFSKYVHFDSIAERMGAVTINRPLFMGMLDEVPQEKMECLGKDLGKSSKTQFFLPRLEL
jgi:hypothetical protein